MSAREGNGGSKRKAVTAYVSPELKEEFDRICDQLAMSRSKYLERCVFAFVRDNRRYLEEGGEDQENGSK